VKRVVLIFALLIPPLFAKELPISKVWELEFPSNEFIVLDFPFAIQSVKSTPFQYKKLIGASEDSGVLGLSLPPIGSESTSLPPPSANPTLAPSQTPQKQQGQQGQATMSPILVEQGDNTLQVFAKKEGELEFVIWGHEEYPVMLKAVFKKKTEGASDKFIKFIDVQKKKNDTPFDKGSHEQVIARLTVALYNHKTPKGYTKESTEQLWAYPDGIQLRLVYQLSGSKYTGEFWEAENLREEKIALHEESFYQQGVYSVCLPQETIEAKGKTQILIVRATK